MRIVANLEKEHFIFKSKVENSATDFIARNINKNSEVTINGVEYSDFHLGNDGELLVVKINGKNTLPEYFNEQDRRILSNLETVKTHMSLELIIENEALDIMSEFGRHVAPGKVDLESLKDFGFEMNEVYISEFNSLKECPIWRQRIRHDEVNLGTTTSVLTSISVYDSNNDVEVGMIILKTKIDMMSEGVINITGDEAKKTNIIATKIYK